MSWECIKCGACCELVYPVFFGKQCEYYDKETHLCKIYETRPEMCVVKHPFGEEFNIIMCLILQKIRGK